MTRVFQGQKETLGDPQPNGISEAPQPRQNPRLDEEGIGEVSGLASENMHLESPSDPLKKGTCAT